MGELVRIPDTPEVFKYYICRHPYPSNDQKDCFTFARWIVSILGCTIPLHAIYYKPEVSDKVIFAVNKVYPRLGRLLGEHRWSDFLKRPKGDEAGIRSQIFNCSYETDRSLQEEDWKRISVEDSFFVNWGIRKWVTKVPYPAPHPLPAEIMEKPGPTIRVFLGPRTSPVHRAIVSSSDESANRTGTGRVNAIPQTPTHGVTRTEANPSLQPAVSGSPRKSSCSDDDKLSSVGSVTNYAKSRVANDSLGGKHVSAPIPQVRFAANPLKYVKNKVGNLDRTRANIKIPVPNLAGARKSQGSRNSSPSSGYATGSTTASTVSSAPSTPAPSLSVQDQELIGIDINDYEDNYDEDITEETCYGSWEITSVPMLSEPLTVKYETGPVDLWANLKPAIRPTGSVTAAEAKAKEDKKAMCPIHMGKCKKGICVAYKEMVRQQENVARKRGKKEEARGKKDGEKNPGSKRDGVKKDPGSKKEGTKEDPGSKKEGEGGSRIKEGRHEEGPRTEEGRREGGRGIEEGRGEGGSGIGGRREGWKEGGKDEPVTDAKATAGNEAVKDDLDQSSKRNGQVKSRPWDEYTSDEDDIDDFFSLPVLGSKPGAKKFYDDDEFFR